MSDKEQARELCGQMLLARKLKPTTKRGFEAVLAFYIGWYKTAELPPYISICLMCGRIEELV